MFITISLDFILKHIFNYNDFGVDLCCLNTYTHFVLFYKIIRNLVRGRKLQIIELQNAKLNIGII